MVWNREQHQADAAAVDAMRNRLNRRGTIVIGEEAIEQATMFYIGQEVGSGQGSAKILLSTRLMVRV